MRAAAVWALAVAWWACAASAVFLLVGLLHQWWPAIPPMPLSLAFLGAVVIGAAAVIRTVIRMMVEALTD